MTDERDDIIAEYDALLKNVRRQLAAYRDKNDELQRENNRLREELDDWKRTAKLGYPAILQAWMDSAVASGVLPGDAP